MHRISNGTLVTAAGLLAGVAITAAVLGYLMPRIDDPREAALAAVLAGIGGFTAGLLVVVPVAASLARRRPQGEEGWRWKR